MLGVMIGTDVSLQLTKACQQPIIRMRDGVLYGWLIENFDDCKSAAEVEGHMWVTLLKVW